MQPCNVIVQQTAEGQTEVVAIEKDSLKDIVLQIRDKLQALSTGSEEEA